MELRALLKGPTAVQVVGSNHRPCGSKSSSLTTMLQAAHMLFNNGTMFSVTCTGRDDVAVQNCVPCDLLNV